MDDIDIANSDRFELLSTYMDGEASAAERKQVEQWLAADPKFRQIYHRLLTLQRTFQALPTPTSCPSAEQTTAQVMARVTRRSRLILWGLGTATAAAMVSAITNLFSGGGLLIPETAQSPAELDNNPTAAAISNLPETAQSPAEFGRSPNIGIQTLPTPLEPSALMLTLDRPPVEFPSAAAEEFSTVEVEAIDSE